MHKFKLFYIHKYLRLMCGLVLLQAFSGNTFAQQSKSKEIDSYIKQKLANSNIPGLAIAVVHYDTVVLVKGYGKTADDKQIGANTPFAIASLSKAFTAAAVLQLVQAGKINLNNPVVKYIPSFSINSPLGKQITVRQVLNQISGMGDTGYPEFNLKKQPQNLDEVIKNLTKAKLVSEPGKAFHYHNPNYQVLAKIVEEVSHEQFSTYLNKHILSPLQMAHTYNAENVNQFFDTTHHLPQGYIYVLGKPVVTKEPDWFVSGDAGIVSTAADMAKWLSDQLKAKGADSSAILGQKYMAIMQSPPPNSNFTYAMGWHANPQAHVLYHSGVMWTYSSQQIILTDKGYGIVLLFNGGANMVTDYYSFLQGIQDIVSGQTPSTSSLPPWLYTAAIVLLLLIILILGIRRVLRVKQWYLNYNKRSAWKTWLYMFIRLVPIILLLLIPYLVTVFSGRVINMQKITLMYVDVVLVIGLAGILNLLIVVQRLIYLAKHKVVTIQ
jgi:CubicO group peptidase (beta-lactamase class C family)